MTSQGRHRPQAHTELVPWRWAGGYDLAHRLQCAAEALEAKGYEIRQMRLTLEDHGKKATVVLHLSPAPVKAWQVGGPKRVYSPHQKYAGQNVGATARRNLSTLFDYIRSLPDVRQAGGEVDGTGGQSDVHPDAVE